MTSKDGLDPARVTLGEKVRAQFNRAADERTEAKGGRDKPAASLDREPPIQDKKAGLTQDARNQARYERAQAIARQMNSRDRSFGR